MVSVRGKDATGAAFGHTLIQLEPHTSAVVVLDHQGRSTLVIWVARTRPV
jgi:hypothetical protein